jgi:hypothetical protein
MTNEIKEIGRDAYASIVAMVDALECDYDRLEEVRDRIADIDADAAESGDDQSAIDADYGALREELAELKAAAGDCAERYDAEYLIQEDALSVEVRSGWTPRGYTLTAEEFCILITTGGPAVRIRGVLDENCEPRRAWLEVQNWGTPWTQYFDASQETLLTYARCFSYGE